MKTENEGWGITFRQIMRNYYLPNWAKRKRREVALSIRKPRVKDKEIQAKKEPIIISEKTTITHEGECCKLFGVLKIKLSDVLPIGKVCYLYKKEDKVVFDVSGIRICYYLKSIDDYIDKFDKMADNEFKEWYNNQPQMNFHY